MRPALVAGWTVIVTTLVVASARAAPADVEVFAIAGGGTIVASPDEEGAAVAACTGPVAGIAEGPGSVELARRGAEESAPVVDGVALWCAIAPPSALELVLWAALRRIRKTPREPERTALALGEDGTLARGAADRDGIASAAALGRARAIALEGAELDDAPAAPAFTVVVAGRASADQVRTVAERLFGPTRAAERPRAPRLRLAQTSERFTELSADRAAPAALYTFIASHGDDDMASRLALEILAGDPGARLPRLLTTRGLARRVDSWELAVSGGTLLGLVLEPGPRVSIDRARRFVDGALKQLRLVGPSRREVERARSRLLLEEYTRREDPLARAELLAGYELVRGGASRAAGDLDALSRVTALDIARAVKENLRDGRRTTVEEYPHEFPSDDPRLVRQSLHTVAPGDTLAALAQRYKVTIAALCRANDLDPKYALSPGQPLWIPAAN
jgi:hypothetical protein